MDGPAAVEGCAFPTAAQQRAFCRAYLREVRSRATGASRREDLVWRIDDESHCFTIDDHREADAADVVAAARAGADAAAAAVAVATADAAALPPPSPRAADDGDQEESDERDARVDALVREARAYVRVNHMYWALWGINQAVLEGVQEFDYLTCVALFAV